MAKTPEPRDESDRLHAEPAPQPEQQQGKADKRREERDTFRKAREEAKKR